MACFKCFKTLWRHNGNLLTSRLKGCATHLPKFSVELLLPMKMINDSKHTTNPKCKFHNSGYCKFQEQCRKRHFSAICQITNCKQDCQARHPRLCKMESNCKFFKKGVCAYKHVDAFTYDSKIEDLEKELKCLRNQIKDLAKENKQKQIEIERITSEKSEMLQKLSKENHDLKAHIEVIKNTLTKTIELKNSEVDNLQQHNGHLKNEIVELKAQISEVSLNKK